jgi:hypothetical protein
MADYTTLHSFLARSLVLLCASLFPLQFVHAAQELKQEVVEALIPKLNSDRIAHFFGNYGVEQISLDSSLFGECRISNLYSIHQEQKFMRTLAVVQFHQPVHQELQQVHQEILQGESIGIALRKNGWKLDKVPLYFGSVFLSPQVQSWMREEKTDQAALHIYNLVTFKDDTKERINYCTIVEVYSPQYLDEEWLKALYSEQHQNFQEKSQEVKRLLEALDFLIQQFPLLIPRAAKKLEFGQRQNPGVLALSKFHFSARPQYI